MKAKVKKPVKKVDKTEAKFPDSKYPTKKTKK